MTYKEAMRLCLSDNPEERWEGWQKHHTEVTLGYDKLNPQLATKVDEDHAALRKEVKALRNEVLDLRRKAGEYNLPVPDAKLVKVGDNVYRDISPDPFKLTLIGVVSNISPADGIVILDTQAASAAGEAMAKEYENRMLAVLEKKINGEPVQTMVRQDKNQNHKHRRR